MAQTMVAERRRHKRIALFSDVQCLYPGEISGRPKRLIDISVGGMFIDCILPPPMGTMVDLQFRLQGYNSPIDAKAQVVFVQDGIGMGVEFTQIDPDVRAFIEAMIAHIDTVG